MKGRVALPPPSQMIELHEVIKIADLHKRSWANLDIHSMQLSGRSLVMMQYLLN